LRDEFCPICGYERTVYHDAQHVIELHVMLLSDLSPRRFNTEERKRILNETQRKRAEKSRQLKFVKL